MTDHTPGPWNILNDESIKVIDSIQFGTIATLGNLRRPHQGPRRSPYEVFANARLIKAAPDLLEALEFAVWDYNGPQEDAPYWVANAYNAIAKAKGDSSGY